VDLDGDGTEDQIEYHFELVRPLDGNGKIPFTEIEADQPENNQLLGFEGKTKRLPLEWIIRDNGEDKAQGTIPADLDNRLSNDTAVTVTEQIIFLEEYMQTGVRGAEWRLFGGRFSDPDGDGTDDGTPVAIQDLQTTKSALNGRGRMVLKVGQVVG